MILKEFVTLDGFTTDKDGKTSFIESLPKQANSEIDNDLLRFIRTIDTILLGANTNQMFVHYCPSATTDKEIVADALNQTPKIIFSKSITAASWGKWEKPIVVKNDAFEEVRKLKQRTGKDMVLWGSISLAQSLLAGGLIDEIQLRVCRLT